MECAGLAKRSPTEGPRSGRCGDRDGPGGRIWILKFLIMKQTRSDSVAVAVDFIASHPQAKWTYFFQPSLNREACLLGVIVASWSLAKKTMRCNDPFIHDFLYQSFHLAIQLLTGNLGPPDVKAVDFLMLYDAFVDTFDFSVVGFSCWTWYLFGGNAFSCSEESK